MREGRVLLTCWNRRERDFEEAERRTERFGVGKSSAEFSSVFREVRGAHMMIHPAQERSEVAKDALDLRRERKLPFRMNVPAVVHGPPLINPAIDGTSVRLEPRFWTDILAEESEGMSALDIRRDNGVRKFPRPHLLPQHERQSLLPTEERLVELDRSFEERELLGKLTAEEREGVTDGGITDSAQREGLPDGDLLRPAPEQRPERPIRQPCPFEKRPREEGERLAAPDTAIALFGGMHLPGPTARAPDVFAEPKATDVLANLGV